MAEELEETRVGLLRPEDAARRLSLSRSRVYELMAAGELISIKVGRARRIPAAALDQFIHRLVVEQSK